ncbi:MAG: hypothetical protein LBP87_12885 [Planctomycetaceae bacterium]|jgi:hypothetical protein|nr:hypothetical protein [Planctomycetaceae bacterium]
MVLGIFQRVFPMGSSWSHSSSDTDLSYNWNDEDKNWHISGTGITERGFGYDWSNHANEQGNLEYKISVKTNFKVRGV